MRDHKPVAQLTLSELINETGDESLSMASGGIDTLDLMLTTMDLPPHARYAEVGCAAGWSANRLAFRRRDVSVLGIDPQPDSIELARRTAIDWGLTNTLYFTGDARAIPAADSTFYSTFAGNIPVFVPAAHRMGMIEECMRVTSEDGWVWAVPLYYPDEGPDPDIADAVERAIGAPIHRGGEDYWLELYREAGLHLCAHYRKRFASQSDAALSTYVETVMASSANQRHAPSRRAELAVALLEHHRLFATNNVRAAYSVLGYRLTDIDAGPFVLTPEPSDG